MTMKQECTKCDILQAELDLIDAVLARRPALADLDTRYSKIERACDVAAKADMAIRGKEEAMHLAADQLKAAKEAGFQLRVTGMNTYEWVNIRAEDAERQISILRAVARLHPKG